MAIPPLAAGTPLHTRPDGTARFIIERVLGTGGFAVTYLAKDTSLDGVVAVKELALADLAGRDVGAGTMVAHTGREGDYVGWVERFEREAKRLHRVSHPNVVRVLDVWRERGTAYYAMSYVEGAAELTAPDSPSWSPRPWSEVEPIAKQLLDALGAVHDAGFIHGDIKPANVLEAEGRATLIDFGTARAGEDLDRTVTSMAYSVDYAPPELMRRERVNEAGPWSDLYSWGLVVSGLITPHPSQDGAPVDARTRQLFVGHGNKDVYSDWTRRLRDNGVPDGWARAIAKCLQIEPTDRVHSAEDLKAMTVATAPASNGPAAVALATDATPGEDGIGRAAKPTGPLVAVVTVVAILVVGIAAVVISGGDTDHTVAPPSHESARPPGNTDDQTAEEPVVPAAGQTPASREQEARAAVLDWVDAYNDSDLTRYASYIGRPASCWRGDGSFHASDYLADPSSQFTSRRDRELVVRDVHITGTETTEPLVVLQLESRRPSRSTLYRYEGLRLRRGRDGRYDVVHNVRSESSSRYIPLPRDWASHCYDTITR